MQRLLLLSSRFELLKSFTVLTGKSLSEALLFAETISVHNMFSPGVSLEFSCIVLVIQSLNSTNNLSSYYGLVDAKIRGSDKDLPVFAQFSFLTDGY